MSSATGAAERPLLTGKGVDVAEELLTLADAAALAGVSRMTVNRWVQSGRLEAMTLPPHYRGKGRWRVVRRSDVMRLASERATERPHGRQSEQGTTDTEEGG